jgi:hypothetical protein
MKNIACSNKGGVCLFTITLSIIILVLSASLQKNLKEVFNLHIKPHYAIACKVSFIYSFSLYYNVRFQCKLLNFNMLELIYFNLLYFFHIMI